MDVSIWLSNINNGVYTNYVDNFSNQKIDGLSLQYLTENDLIDLGIAIMGDRKHIMHSIDNLFDRSNIKIEIDAIQQTHDNTIVDMEIPSTSTSITSMKGNQSEIKDIMVNSELLPLISLPDYSPQKLLKSNDNTNINRIEYVCPWSIEHQTDFNQLISSIFLSSSVDPSQSGSFEHDIDYKNNLLILHGTFINLSTFMKQLYLLNNCECIDIPIRISYFLKDSGELNRISRQFDVIPFINNDDKLSFYSSSPSHLFNANKAIMAVQSVLKTLDCSSRVGSLKTRILGTLLSNKRTKIPFIKQISPYGYIEYWNNGHKVLLKNNYKYTRVIQKNKIHHLLLIKPYAPSNMDTIIDIINEWIPNNSATCKADIGLVWYAMYRIGYIKDLQSKYGLFIGGCPNSKSLYACGGNARDQSFVLNDICNNSPYSSLSYCCFNNDFSEYLSSCNSLELIKLVIRRYNKKIKPLFVYDDEKEDNKIFIVIPKLYKTEVENLIKNELEPSLITIKINDNNNSRLLLKEYLTLRSKICTVHSSILPPHIAFNENQDTLYLFHYKYHSQNNKENRIFIQNQIKKYQQMECWKIDIATKYEWLNKYLNRITKYSLNNETKSALITLINNTDDDDNIIQSLYVRCNQRISSKLNQTLMNILNRIIRIPIYARLEWINQYEIDNDVNILNDITVSSCLKDGVLYIYNRVYYISIEFVNKYINILLKIGLTYNQFPNDEYILEKDCEFLMELIPIFNIIPDKQFLFKNRDIINFIFLIIYQTILSTRYDLTISLWKLINNLKIKDNILIQNSLHIIFVVAGKEFSKYEMKSFLIDSEILYNPNMIQFVYNSLTENQQQKELKLFMDVLQDIHVDNDINWSFDEIESKLVDK